MTSPQDPQQPTNPQQPGEGTPVPPQGAPQGQNPFPQQQIIVQQPPEKPFYKKAGCMIPLVLVGLLILIMAGCTLLTGKAIDSVDKEIKKTEQELEITYEIGGDSQDIDVTYTQGDGMGSSSENGVQPGWTKTVTVKGIFGGSMYIDNGYEEEGTIECTVKANGKVVAQNTASGSLAHASCNPTRSDIEKAYEE